MHCNYNRLFLNGAERFKNHNIGDGDIRDLVTRNGYFLFSLKIPDENFLLVLLALLKDIFLDFEVRILAF